MGMYPAVPGSSIARADSDTDAEVYSFVSSEQLLVREGTSVTVEENEVQKKYPG
jgi:hypothetical protein